MLRATALLVLLPAAGFAQAQAQRYELDPVHTRVLFAVSHAGFSQALGTIGGSTGALLFDPADWRSARVEVEVPLAKLDLGDPDWNAAALGRRLLRADTYPRARFVSTSVTPRDAKHARACGDLSLRGATLPLCLDVTLNALERHPMPPFRHTVGFSATGTLDRKAFGIDAWEGLIGDAVELRIEVEAVLQKDPRPGGAKPEVVEPEVVEPDVAEPDVAEPDVADPEVAESGVAEPGVASPEVAEPDADPLPASEPTRPT